MFQRTQKARDNTHAHTGYVSEFTQFIDEFMEKHPEVEENRRRGWKIFWDRKVDFEDLEKAARDSVPVTDHDS